MENQYNPLIGPGTDNKTKTNNKSDRAVNARAMAGEANREWWVTEWTRGGRERENMVGRSGH